MSKGYRAKTPGEREASPFPTMQSQMWNRFYREARSRGKHWKGCAACPPRERDPKAILQVHHVISQQRLKRLAKDQHLPPLERLRLLTDPRNSMLLCEDCHSAHTNRAKKLPRRAVSNRAWDFAFELDLIEELMDEYPREDES